ncbi:uncharacterized protein [Cherax quadricarinatus]|uniref:uncharacterized protein isoform X2 n=1 Tax=Cherax quadricarinatus TaxID=27406 RepID=UPI002378A01E|nr:uncharacterized protein LOC128700340 isoform X2 [Cherax quadricarinatus]
MTRQMIGASLLVLLVTSLIATTFGASVEAQEEARKFAAKPNDIKKQQQLQQQANVKQSGEFSWSRVFSLGVQMLLSLLGGDNSAIDKMDGASPVESILTAVISYLTGSNDPQEVGVMAKQASELFGLVVTLLDALRTSFSQRSFEARSLGSSDPLADAAVAATTMLKSYIKTYETEDDVCMQKFLCEANSDCVYGTGDTGYLFCQMGTYGMSYILERSTYTPFEIYNDAGRRGRVGENCQEIFNECNF